MSRARPQTHQHLCKHMLTISGLLYLALTRLTLWLNFKAWSHQGSTHTGPTQCKCFMFLWTTHSRLWGETHFDVIQGALAQGLWNIAATKPSVSTSQGSWQIAIHKILKPAPALHPSQQLRDWHFVGIHPVASLCFSVWRAQGGPLRMRGRCLGADSMVKGCLTPCGHGTKQVNLWPGIRTRWKMNMLALARFIDVPHQERAGSPRLFAQLPGGRARSNTSIYYGALLKKCWHKDK